MSVARKILWNTLAQIIGKVCIGIIGLVTVKFLTFYLGLDSYGFYKSVFEFIAFFSIAADMGLYTIGVREMTRDEKKQEAILANLLAIRTILVVLTIIIAIGVSFFVKDFQKTGAVWALFIVGIATVLAILTGSISSVLQAHLKMQYNSLASVLGKIAAFGCILFSMFILYPKPCPFFEIDAQSKPLCFGPEEGIYPLFLAGVIGNLVMFLTTYYYTRKLVKIRYKLDFKFWKEVLWPALPYGIALVLNTVYFRIGSILLLLLKGQEYVGIYGMPLTMLEAAGIVPLYFMNSMLPILTKSLKEGKEKYQKIIQYAFDFLLMGSLPIVVGTYILAYPFIKISSSGELLSRLNEGFYGSDIVLQILIFALLFSFVNSLFGYLLVASNNESTLLPRNLIGASLTVILSLILIPWIDVRGAAIANVLAEFYVAMASYFIAKKRIDFQIQLGRTFKILLSSLAMGLVIYLLKEPTYYWLNLQNKNLLILIPLAGIIYGAMLLLTRTVTREMIEMIRKRPANGKPVVEPELEV